VRFEDVLFADEIGLGYGALVIIRLLLLRRGSQRGDVELNHRWKDRDRSPNRQYASTDVFDARPGDLAQFEFNWTICDYASAVRGAKCQIAFQHSLLPIHHPRHPSSEYGLEVPENPEYWRTSEGAV
jgi:hypothetical protein